MKSLRFVILAILIVLIAPSRTWSANVDELKSQITSKQQEIQELEKQIEATQSTLNTVGKQKQTLTAEVTNLNNKIKQLEADIRLNTKQIEKAELTIEVLSGEIGDRTQSIAEQKMAIASLLRSLRENDGQSLFEIVIANDQISEFFDQVEYLNTLDDAIAQNIGMLTNAKVALEQSKMSTEAEQTKLASLKNNLVTRKSTETEVKNEKSQLLTQTKQSETAYQKLLREREAERKALQDEISAMEYELQKLIDPSRLPSKKSGVLAWPVENPVITQGFGFTEFATARTDIYKGQGHNGIDLRARLGTPILAADDGEVWDIGNTDLTCPGGSYGKWVLLRHANGLATIYGHLSGFNTTKGAVVKRGQIIAFSGQTGYSTGPHLHFTVYDAGTVKFGPSKSGRCKYLPFGGYVNPLDYL
ncbi:MAG: peptidoglycan DD-metalloendopeptidase family protein [Patescibacteria group bacterium]